MTAMTTRIRGLLAALLPLAIVSASPGTARQPIVAPRTRTYYIAADEVTWDYVPGGRDEIAGRPYADTAFFAKAPAAAGEHGVPEGALPRIHRQHLPAPSSRAPRSGSISASSAR